MQVKAPIYLLQPNRCELDTTVVSNEQGMLEFQESIFHLQGGGQPNDKGWLEVDGNKIDIVGGAIERETGRVTHNRDSFDTSWQVKSICLLVLQSRWQSTLQPEPRT